MSLIPSAPFAHVLLRFLHFNGRQSCIISSFVPQSRGYGGTSVVVQAPTGSGKTYIFELLCPNLKTQAVFTVPTRRVTTGSDTEFKRSFVGSADRRFFIVKCRELLTMPETMPPNLDHWLGQHHRIRDSIIWEFTDQLPFPPVTLDLAWPYVMWPQSNKDALQAAFDAAWNFGSIQLNDPPPNILHPADHSAPTTALSHSDAHSLYLASVGQSLAVEIDNRVGWSVANYSNDNLAILFDSREFFVWSASDDGYEIQDLKGGYVVPASPHTMHRFLKDNDLIGDHRYGTIVRVIKWCHHNLSHNEGPHTTKTYHDVWQYRGEAPVVRTIEGTTDHATPSLGVRHYTAGCHGTAGFLRAILRTVNIPVVHDHQCGHALPYFSADGLHLSHGDDPYDRNTFADPPYSMSELLLDQTKFDSWFGSGVSEDAKCKHIGKRVQELAIQYLPTLMLRDYCDDQATGKSHTDGAVAADMPAYTVSQLEARHLWSRMDAKIASMGGCDHVPYS